MAFARVFGVDRMLFKCTMTTQFLGQDLVDIIVDTDGSTGKAKRHDLTLDGHPFIAFTDSHPMASTGQIQLGETNETPGLTWPIQRLTYQEQQLSALDCQVIKTSLIDTQSTHNWRLTSGFRTNRKQRRRET